jgi:hypothetical protein
LVRGSAYQKLNFIIFYMPQHTTQSGVIALLLVFIILSLAISLAVPVGVVFVNRAKTSGELAHSDIALYAAEAGLEDGIYRAKNLMSYLPNYTLAVGDAEADINITANGDQRIVISEGRSGSSIRRMRASVYLNIIVPEFFYGAQIGVGGAELEQNAKIEGVGGSQGNVYSNGPIVGANGATITGELVVSAAAIEDMQARSTVCNADQVFGQANPVIDMAQSFVPSQTQTYPKISMYIKKVQTPGDRTVHITADAGGKPSTTSLASGTLQSALVTSSYGWVDITFPTPAALTAGTTYWIVLDAARSASNYWVWCKDSGGGYADGSPSSSQSWSSDPWTAVSGDLAFRTHYGTTIVSVKDVDVLGDVRANTINTSKICGNAYYQTLDVSTLNFINSPSSPTCPAPLTPGTAFGGQTDPPIINMPISDANIQDWKDDAALGDTIEGNCGDNGVPACVIPEDGTLYIGPKVITGNIVLTKKQKMVVTGTLHVQGSISMDSTSGASIKCDPSFGVQSCVVVTDSWVHIRNNATFGGSGTAGSYIMFLSTLPDCNGGDQQASCTHNNSAIEIHNNAVGALFYTNGSQVYLHNGVTVSEVTANKLHLANGAIVRYEKGLESAFFSGGPGGAFAVLEWIEIE